MFIGTPRTFNIPTVPAKGNYERHYCKTSKGNMYNNYVNLCALHHIKTWEYHWCYGIYQNLCVHCSLASSLITCLFSLATGRAECLTAKSLTKGWTMIISFDKVEVRKLSTECPSDIDITAKCSIWYMTLVLVVISLLSLHGYKFINLMCDWLVITVLWKLPFFFCLASLYLNSASVVDWISSPGGGGGVLP